jgi:hypothetical protein
LRDFERVLTMMPRRASIFSIMRKLSEKWKYCLTALLMIPAGKR